MTSKQLAVQQQIATEMVQAYQELEVTRQKLENRRKKVCALQDLATQLVGKLDIPTAVQVHVEEEVPRKLDPYYCVTVEFVEYARVTISERGDVNYHDVTGDEWELDISTALTAIAKKINRSLSAIGTWLSSASK